MAKRKGDWDETGGETERAEGEGRQWREKRGDVGDDMLLIPIEILYRQNP